MQGRVQPNRLGPVALPLQARPEKYAENQRPNPVTAAVMWLVRHESSLRVVGSDVCMVQRRTDIFARSGA